ncbi:LexA repressor [Sphingomonas sp. S2M10]|uniref:LexA family protein n=1 Tax=Sphingomonas sp. S2M10 TaxID=2705010 RepID=UPI0014564AB1|nr:Rrf2 family transcriptional regulator [Sphingomonas sp. S2M10]NLS26203.1 LexA repressor [Sphingomonas sp. S2M10]
MDGTPIRLTPAMSSRKLQALDLIKRYYLRHGSSPTLGEIAGGLGITRQRAHSLVRALERDQMVQRARGKTRGIMLANAAAQVSESDALLQLCEAGWTVRIGNMELVPPGTLTTTPLPAGPALDHKRDIERGSGGYGRDRKRRDGAEGARVDRAGEPAGA